MTKSRFYIFIIVTLLTLIGGGVTAQTDIVYEGRVVNVTDANNQRQGEWVYFFDTLHTAVSCIGKYVDSKRDGIWIEYFRNGNVKSEISYNQSVKYGHAKFYYENGIPSEEGFWDGAHWIGKYKLYYSNGVIAYDWNYNDEGKRVGMQYYYYDNGKIMSSGYWVDGAIDGTLTEYFKNGNVRSESQWKSGRIDGESFEYNNSGSLRGAYVFENGKYVKNITNSKISKPTKPVAKDSVEVQPENIPADKDTIINNANKVTYGELFTGTGQFKLLRDDKSVDREGQFVKGILITGRRYYYDSSGTLRKIVIYEDGKIISTIDKRPNN